MIRATVISAIDQALLSALNLGLAVLLIHFASKQEYGLYAQLINLQAFFSPLHAGVFVSAYLAIASKMDTRTQVTYRTSMARAELVTTIASSVVVVIVCAAGSRLFGHTIAFATCIAFALALLGLWWREFVRQIQFAMQRYDRTLNIDAIYCFTTGAMILLAIATVGLSATSVLWCMGVGALVATALPLIAAVRRDSVDSISIKSAVSMSWIMGRWEVLGSILTWGYAQSYVYFAALHGGLDAAAEVSAGRLLATPLSLMWASYANVLRPSASRLLAVESYEGAHRLALRSAGFVVVSSFLYAVAIYSLIPIINQKLFGSKFAQLQTLAMWWIAYTALTGISTVASSLLRSAMQFRQVFTRQVLSCMAAIVLLTLSLRFAATQSLIIALVAIELISASLFWHQMRTALLKQSSV